eukprot:3301508-Rhodomonas_salina.1
MLPEGVRFALSLFAPYYVLPVAYARINPDKVRRASSVPPRNQRQETASCAEVRELLVLIRGPSRDGCYPYAVWYQHTINPDVLPRVSSVGMGRGNQLGWRNGDSGVTER